MCRFSVISPSAFENNGPMVLLSNTWQIPREMLCLMELLAFTFAFKAPPTSKMSQNIKQNFGASVRLDCEPSTDRNIFNQNIFELKDKLLW